MGVSQSKNQDKNQDSNSKKINNDAKNIPNNSTNGINNSTNGANNTDNKLSKVKDNIFNKDIKRGGYKSKNDPDYSWHHDTLEGRKVLSSLTDAFYMD